MYGILQISKSFLSVLGYRRDLAANGIEALDAIKRQHYDVILMDMRMPEMDGIRTTEEIRRLFPSGSSPQIIALTAAAMDEDRERCLEAGMNDYLSKPLRPKAVEEKLRLASGRIKPARHATPEAGPIAPRQN